jgi:hypothetical protein
MNDVYESRHGSVVAGAPDAEIEITPEMIEAAIILLEEYEGEVSTATLARLVGEAMMRAAPLQAQLALCKHSKDKG